MNFDRVVTLTGPIKPETLSKLQDEMRSLAMKSADDPATLQITTAGGDCAVGFAIYDLLRSVYRVKLTTIGLGEIGSMGVAIFLAGEERKIAPYGTIYLHELITTFHKDTHQSLSHMRSFLTNLETDQRHYIEILAERTQQSKEKILEMMQVKTTLSAEEAVKLGFAHKIL